MKKLYKFFSVIFVFILFSCSYEIPKSVSIKTNAEYNFSVGKFSKDLSEYIDAKTISEKLNQNQSESSQTKFAVYDYNPGEDTNLKNVQKYLAEIQLQEIPIDVSQYLSKLDALGLDGKSFDTEIEIPSLSVNNVNSTIDLPDFDSIFRGSSSINVDSISIPQGINGAITTPISIDIDVKNPEFSDIKFSSGSLNIVLTSSTTSTSIYSEVVVRLLDSDVNEISKSDSTKISTSGIVSIPLDKKSIKQKMALKVSGLTYGGSLGNFTTYSIVCNFSDSTKIAYVKGLKMDLGDAGYMKVNQDVYITTADSFINCEIGKGVLSSSAKIPDDWTGIKTEPNFVISGGLAKSSGAVISESDFDKTNESLPYIINRSLDLDGFYYSKGDINISGYVKLSLDEENGADLNFEDNVSSVEIVTNCNIENIKFVTVDTAKLGLENKLKYSSETSLPDEVSTYLKSVVLTKAGISGTYTNTLPEGNDFTIKATSKFLYQTSDAKQETITSASENKEFNLVSDTKNTVLFTSSPKIDYGFELVLPGSTTENPDYAVFKNVEIGAKYKIAFSVSPVFEWESVTINTNESGAYYNNTIETNFNLSEMFKEFSSKLGSDDFFKKIELKSLPLYLYCAAPNLDIFNDIKYIGSLKLVCGTETLSILGTDSEKGELKFCEQESLKLNYSGTVISYVEKMPYSLTQDIASLINNTKNATDSALKIAYEFSVTDSDKGEQEITITKEDFDALKESNPDVVPSIGVKAIIEIPLEISVTDDISISINKIADLSETEDVFNRSEKPDMENVLKYAKIVEYMQVDYNSENSPFVYSSDSGLSPFFIFDTGMDNLENNVYGDGAKGSKDYLSLNSGVLKVTYNDIEKILNQYPFTPKMSIKMPKGEVKIVRNPQLSLNCNIKVKTDGTVKIFGD